MKVLRRQDGRVWLMPRNPSYDPIPGDEARILGKVVGVLRVLREEGVTSDAPAPSSYAVPAAAA